MKEKVLAYLKAHKGEFVSGEAISNTLGVTRASVWKTIKMIKSEGYGIESITSKGYRLDSSMGVYNQAEIAQRLSDNKLWKTVHFFNQLGSTNDYAKQIGMDFGDRGTVIVADVQTNGRGRLGRLWESPSQTGIWMSLLVKPDFAPSHASKLTQIAALATSRAISTVCHIENHIKWPNDIHIQDKKVCGILTEMNAELSGINYLVIGIGINVNTENFSEELTSTATSLMVQSGAAVDRLDLLAACVREFETLYLQFEKTLSLEAVRNELVNRSNIIGHQVIIHHNNQVIEAKAIDIDENGNLIVENQGDRLEIFYGEVQRVRKI